MEINYKVIGSRIRLCRAKKNITQEQLAFQMGYSTQFISNIESKNHQTFSLGTIWKVALVLNIDIKELFNPINENNTTEIKKI